MKRREFLRNLFGGAAAAVVGAAVPAGLRTDEMAALEERVIIEWIDGKLVVTNLRNEAIQVDGVLHGEARVGEWYHVKDGDRLRVDWGHVEPKNLIVTVRNLTNDYVPFKLSVRA